MNIHFKNKKLFNELMQNKIFEIEVGSYMYNLQNENSDKDILIIYIDSVFNRGTLNSHHQLQYNDENNNINYIFTSLEQFCLNIITGDSTINYEVLQSNEFKKKFPNLRDALNYYNTKIIKSYLGMAKRDLKTIRKRYNPKTASHFIRGLYFAEAIMNNEHIFNLDLRFLKNIKAGECDLSSTNLSAYEYKMNNLRESLEDKQIDAVRLLEIETEIGNITKKYIDFIYREIDSKKYFIRAHLFNEFGYLI
jgi:predicted nucleotidyltransferase